jgi:serine/threonine-protein kinase RsbW
LDHRIMPAEELLDVLVLDSRLTEVRRAQAWAEALAARLNLSEKTRYALLLCLEESLANIVLHGYSGESGHPIAIRCWLAEGLLFVAVEDRAPVFAPAGVPPESEASPQAGIESLQPGGYGIGLLRHFARELVYEKLPEGNRLIMGFPNPS